MKIVTDFSSIKFIEKDSCGLGGTSAVLDITDQTVIICSPLRGMIQTKENIRKEHQVFLYGHTKAKHAKGQSQDTWAKVSNLLSCGNNFILNTTPNQIVALKEYNPPLYNKIKTIPVFVDESHVAAENSYRPELADFMHLLFTEWQANYTLSTATPCFEYLDIPIKIKEKMSFYRIKRTNEPLKPITVYPSESCVNKIIEEHAKGNKVVVFTNSKQLMQKIVLLEGITTQFLVGDSLNTKIKTIKEFSEVEMANMAKGILSTDIDVSILSTKFLTGYDITFPATVFIVSNYNQIITVDNRTVNDIVQAYGRLRNKVISAAVFYNNKNFHEKNDIPTYERRFDEALKNPAMEHLTQSGINHTRVLHEFLPRIEEIRTFSSINTFTENLSLKGFQVDVQPIQHEVLVHEGISIQEKMKHLLFLDTQTLAYHLEKVFSSIQGDCDSYHGYGKQYLALFSSAYICSAMDNEWLHKSISRSTTIDRLIDVMKTFIDTNTNVCTMNQYDKQGKYHAPKKAMATALNRGSVSESFRLANLHSQMFQKAVKVVNTLYTINRVKDGKLQPEDSQQMEINERISEQVKRDLLVHLSNELNKTLPEIMTMIDKNSSILNNALPLLRINPAFYNTRRSICRSLTFEPTLEHLEYIDEKLAKHIRTLTKYDPRKDKPFNIRARLDQIEMDKKAQLDRHKYFLLGMLSVDIAGHSCGFRKKMSDHREYNFATKCPSYLRKYTPYHTIEIDIKSACPQFIDRILGTNVAFQVYNNLMEQRNISRHLAKVLYNSTLNNYHLKPCDAVKVYNAAGYSQDESERLAQLTCGSKIFNTMTLQEVNAMDAYKTSANLINPIRIHDGFIVWKYNHNAGDLPLEANGIHFNVKDQNE